jgi:hypothetical protein
MDTRVFCGKPGPLMDIEDPEMFGLPPGPAQAHFGCLCEAREDVVESHD